MQMWSNLWPFYSVILDYLDVRDDPVVSDYIIGFGSDCIDVPHRVAQLFHGGLASRIIFCGGRGRLTGSIEGTEAAWFRDVALDDRVPGECIILEEESSNAKENVVNARRTMLSRGALPSQVILVTQNVLQRRAWATWCKQVPEVTGINCPPIRTFDGWRDKQEAMEQIQLCLGEIDRLRTYAEKGDLLPQKIPPEVAEAACVVQDALDTMSATGKPGI